MSQFPRPTMQEIGKSAEPTTVPHRGVLLPVLLTFAILNAFGVLALAAAGYLVAACVSMVMLGLELAAFKVVRDYRA